MYKIIFICLFLSSCTVYDQAVVLQKESSNNVRVKSNSFIEVLNIMWQQYDFIEVGDTIYVNPRTKVLKVDKSTGLPLLK